METKKNVAPSDLSVMQGLKIGFALTGSHCTLEKALAAMKKLRELEALITPIISPAIMQSDTRFGSAASWRERLCLISGQDDMIDTITKAEPIGPQAPLDSSPPKTCIF